jgi:hypothetical protein
MLDLVEAPLRHHSIKFVRLDGTMTQAKRENVLMAFRSDPEVMRRLLINCAAPCFAAMRYCTCRLRRNGVGWRCGVSLSDRGVPRELEDRLPRPQPHRGVPGVHA